MGVPWINVLFTNNSKQTDERFRPVPTKRQIPEVVFCPLCPHSRTKATLDKTILVYKCKYGHEITEEYYYYNKKFRI